MSFVILFDYFFIFPFSCFTFSFPSWFINIVFATLSRWILGTDPIYLPDEDQIEVFKYELRSWRDSFYDFLRWSHKTLKEDPDFEQACWGILLITAAYIWANWDFSYLFQPSGKKWQDLRWEIAKIRYPVDESLFPKPGIRISDGKPFTVTDRIMVALPEEAMNPGVWLRLGTAAFAAGWLIYLAAGGR